MTSAPVARAAASRARAPLSSPPASGRPSTTTRSGASRAGSASAPMTGAQLRTRRSAASRPLLVAGGSGWSYVMRTSSCQSGGRLECARMRSVVTGGAGFIGSNLVDALLDAGDEVLVVDNLSSGREANLAGALERGATLERRDVRDAAGLLESFRAFEPDRVFHLAAQIDVRVSIDDPAQDAEVNVIGTINVLEAARLTGVGRFVFASTGGAIYGETTTLPTPETEEPLPMAGYGQSKFCAERYL